MAKKRETESLLIAAQDSAIRTNHIKARIDKTQQNSKCRLCGDRYETINHIISECSKLAQKEYKATHDWVGKVIHREMCKKFKFDHAYKWYMYNTALVLENDTHKLQWDFDIKTYHLISARGCPCGVMVKALDCGIVVREFVLQSRYYVHFRTNTLRKGMNPLILSAMG